MRRRARLLIAGNFHWHAGFSQTVAAYVAAAAAAECEIRVATRLSRFDAEVPRHLPLEDDLGWGSHLVVMFEAKQFLSSEQLDLAERFPRHRRAVVDFDAHWSDEAGDGGPDGTAAGYPPETWRKLYSGLSDLVLQPRIAGALPAGATYFPCFGLASARHPLRLGATVAGRDYDLQYIGSNWWRWDPLIEVVHAARAIGLHRIRVCGRWWDGDVCAGFEDASANEPGLLRALGVEVSPPVPFGAVLAEAGRAAITPVLVRPLVAGTGLLTPRMFEALAAGGIPAIPPAAAFVTRVYGEESSALLLGNEPTDVLASMTTDFVRHAEVVGRIQEHVLERYSYPRLLTDLLALLDGST